MFVLLYVYWPYYFRDTITVALINCGTSVYAGFAIFSMIGYLAFKTGVSVEDAATSGKRMSTTFCVLNSVYLAIQF